MPIVIQPSFARGEIGPSLYGRVDAAAYQVALRTAWNLIIHAHGGASNRPGLEFIGQCKEHTYAPRLIPFRFKTTDTYMLEFGNLYMRVVRDDAHVTETPLVIEGISQSNPAVVTITAHGYSNGDEVALSSVVGMTEVNNRRFLVAGVTTDTFQLTSQEAGVDVDSSSYGAYASGGTAAKIFELVTPYAQADLGLIKFTQSADVMTLVHPSYDARELSRTDHNAWTLATIDFEPGQIYPEDLTATVNGTAQTTTYRYRITALADDTFEESLPALNDTTRTITGATQANPVVITATSHGFANREEVQIDGVVGMTELNGRRYLIDNVTTNTFELKGIDGTAYTAYVSGGTANLTLVKVTTGNATLSATNNVTLAWSEAVGAQRYVVYKEKNGLYGFLQETEDLDFVDDGSITPDLDSTPPRPRDPFEGEDNMPGAVGYYQQRRVFGGANNTPDTSDFSRTADYSNFTFATPTQADDAFRVTLTSQQVNQIRHYVALTHLLALTSGQEWRLDGGDQRFSIDTVRQNPQSAWGCGHQRPVVIGNVVLYVQENNSAVRSIGYTFAVDGYEGTDMTLLANHLFRDYFLTDWDFGRSPDPLVYGVRSDGIATVLTFNQEQEVLAWARWGTRWPDKFEAVGVVRPSATAIDDAAYFVVRRRRADGTTVRYIERTHTRRFLAVEDCFFVDSGLTFNNPVTITGVSGDNPAVITTSGDHGLVAGDTVDFSDIIWEPETDEFDNDEQPDQLNNRRYFVATTPTSSTFTAEDEDGTDVDGSDFSPYVEGGFVRKAVSTLSGFHHLSGENVTALADGDVLRDLSVDEKGQVTLPQKFSRVHIGFGYYADAELLNIEARQAGTIQHLLKNVHKITVRFERSRGLWVGPDKYTLVEMLQRQEEAYGGPTNLLTGDMEIDLPPVWNTNGRVLLRQRDPLPMTLLAVIPQFETEGADE